MYQGNWKCSTCGGPITELPFQPRSESGLTCRTCYGKQKDKDNNEAPAMPVAGEAPEIPDEAGLATEAPPADDFGGDAAPAGDAAGAPAAAAPEQTFSPSVHTLPSPAAITQQPTMPSPSYDSSSSSSSAAITMELVRLMTEREDKQRKEMEAISLIQIC